MSSNDRTRTALFFSQPAGQLPVEGNQDISQQIRERVGSVILPPVASGSNGAATTSVIWRGR